MIGIFTIILAVLMVLSSGLVTHDALAATKAIIAYAQVGVRVTPLWITEEQGFFNKYGIEAEVVLTRGAPTSIAALVSGEVQIVYGGGPTVLSAVAGGTELKVLANYTSRVTDDLVARPGIQSHNELRGKLFGIQSLGGTGWMNAVLGLEHLGLDPTRDNIKMVESGPLLLRSQALEAGRIDATTLDSSLSYKLKQRGFPILAEFHRVNIPVMSGAVVVTRGYLQQNTVEVVSVLKALLEGLACVLSTQNKPIVLKTIMKRLKISDPAAAEEGYRELLRSLDRKPYPSMEGLRNQQRLMKSHNPRIADVKVQGIIDSRFMKELDESGFIDGLYNKYRAK
jgi:NitT/TauT family transport system substrate-binding protein